MDAQTSLLPLALSADTMHAINSIKDDALDWLRRADNDNAKLLAVRDAAHRLQAFGFAATVDARHLISDSAINVHKLDPNAVKAELARGIEQAEWAEFEPLPDNGSPPIAVDASASPSRFTPTWLDNITVDEDPAYIVEGIIPAGPSFGIIPAPPKSLKSFLLTDLLMHLAIGKPYADRRVQQGVVVYITSEGIQGVRRRLVAMRRYHEVEGKSVPFALIPAMPNLGAGRQDLDQLIAEINKAISGLTLPVRAVVVDTLRRATPGKSENDPKDMSVFIANCEAIATIFNCFVGAVHHSPRSDETRSSGTNAIDAAADVILQVNRPDPHAPRATVTVGRLKDGEEGDKWAFEVRSMQVGIDRDGAPKYGGYVVLTEPSKALGSENANGGYVVLTEPSKALGSENALKEPLLPPKCKVAMEALAEAMAEVGIKPSPSPYIPTFVTRVVTWEQWRAFAYCRGISNGATLRARQKAFKEATEYLRTVNRISSWDDSIWIVPK
jgi:hypothetical protein